MFTNATQSKIFSVQKTESRDGWFFSAFFWTSVYAVSIHYAHSDYLSVEFDFWGFRFFRWPVENWLFLGACIGIISSVLPHRIRTPGSLILLVLYFLVIIPSFVITLGVSADAATRYGWLLGTLCFSFSLICILLRYSERETPHEVFDIGVSTRFVILGLWCVSFAFLFFSFQDKLQFVGLELTYEQRATGRARNFAEAYSQTYLGFVLSPAMFAIGLYRRRLPYLMTGIAGFLLMYAITAERTVFMMPWAMVLLHYGLNKQLTGVQFFRRFAGLLIAIVLMGVLLRDVWQWVEAISIYLVFRTIAVPGAALWQYDDVFSNIGYTYWSNVTGIGLFVERPAVFAGDPRWPQLGYVVAERLQQIESNSNANLFAYDGIAAAGNVGIVLISLMLSFFLVVLDRYARYFPPKLAMVATLPIGITLTNGSLFSVLLSFGGLFWVLTFMIGASKKKPN